MRFLKLLLVSIAMVLTATISSAQKYEILKNIDGHLLYSDGEEWLLRSDWEERYGHRAFKEHFGDGTLYDHAQEQDILRDNILNSVTLLGEGNVVWSRVIECDAPIESLKLAARKRMASIVHESDNTIIGGVIEHGFVRDDQGRPWGIKHAHWKGIVTYEFREGRYRVSVSHIQYKAERGASLGIYSLSFSTSKAYAPISNIIYPYSRRANMGRYYRLVDFIDYNFCSIFVLFESAIDTPEW